MISTALLVMIYLSFVSLGLPDSVLGSAWPSMLGDIHAPVWGAGLVQMVVSCGTIVSSLNSARLIRRFGTGRLTAFSVLTTALALLGISFTGYYAWLILMAVPLGLGAGAIDTCLNNYVALHYKASHMNFLHCFYGIGVSISPYLMALALSEKNNWHIGYRWAAYIQLGITAVMFLSKKIKILLTK